MDITTITITREFWKKLTKLKLDENEAKLETLLEKMFENYIKQQEGKEDAERMSEVQV